MTCVRPLLAVSTNLNVKATDSRIVDEDVETSASYSPDLLLALGDALGLRDVQRHSAHALFSQLTDRLCTASSCNDMTAYDGVSSAQGSEYSVDEPWRWNSRARAWPMPPGVQLVPSD